MSASKERSFEYAEAEARIYRLNRALVIGFAMFYGFVLAGSFIILAQGGTTLPFVVATDIMAVLFFAITWGLVRMNPSGLQARTVSGVLTVIMSLVGSVLLNNIFVAVFACFPPIGYTIYNDRKFQRFAVAGLTAAAVFQFSATSEQITASSSQAEGLSVENLDNADSAKNFLNEVMAVSAEFDKYTEKE